MTKTIGICCLIAARDLKVINYALDSYELAIEQALELQKYIGYEVMEWPEEIGENGLRQKVYSIVDAREMISVNEIEVSDKILEVKE